MNSSSIRLRQGAGPAPCSDSPRSLAKQNKKDGSAELRAASGPTPRRLAAWIVFCYGIVLMVGAAQAEEVRGRIVWQGPLPIPERIAVKAKASQGPDSIKGCGHEKDSPELRVGPSGGVENVVIWVEEDGLVPPAQGTVLLDQKACEFLPHVLTVRVGDRVAIRNSDPVVHSVRIFQEGEPSYLMNKWQKVKAPDLYWTAETPGRYVARCGVHLWMYAWIVVLPPGISAVSNPAGEFQLSGVPAGKQRVHFWHEKAGEWEHEVEISGSEVDLGGLSFPSDRKE